MTTKNVAQTRMDTGGATRSRTGLIGFAIQSATPAECTARQRINNLRAHEVADCPPVSHIAADFYQMPIQGFDSLHPLHLSACRMALFPSERNVQPSTVGREWVGKFTFFSRIYSEAQP
jgi:hypothetical protein